MTEPVDTSDDQADEEGAAFIAELRADTHRFERKMRRHRRLAYWFLIPYTMAGAAFFRAAVAVHDAGMRVTAAVLYASFMVIIACGWIQPEILRRRDKKEEDR